MTFGSEWKGITSECPFPQFSVALTQHSLEHLIYCNEPDQIYSKLKILFLFLAANSKKIFFSLLYFSYRAVLWHIKSWMQTDDWVINMRHFCLIYYIILFQYNVFYIFALVFVFKYFRDKKVVLSGLISSRSLVNTVDYYVVTQNKAFWTCGLPDISEPSVSHYLHGILLAVDSVFRTRPTIGPPVQVKLHGLVGGWQVSARDCLLMRNPDLNWNRTHQDSKKLPLAWFLSLFMNLHRPSQINEGVLEGEPDALSHLSGRCSW